MNNLYFDLEEGVYRTYPDGDIATGYDIRNQLEKLTQENQDLENLYILARDNLSKSLLENADLKERISYLERSNDRKEETIIELRKEQELDLYEDVINKALNKIESMFNNGDEDKIIDDLLELDKILRSKE